jgi:hypothetical protein
MESSRIDRLDAMLRENRLIRGAWTESHERVCLLAALSPEAGDAQSASACPSEVMPRWMAHLTPWIDDQPSDEAWPQIITRYALLARRWNMLDTEAWERVRRDALTVIVKESRNHVALECRAALRAIDGVLGWLERGTPEVEREVVQKTARQAPRDGSQQATDLRSRASARQASRAAAKATEQREEAVEAAASCVSLAAWENRKSAADRICFDILDALEREIERAEQRA